MILDFQTMKVIVALLALLAVCSAHVFKRQMPNTNCDDVAALSYINNVNPEVCDSVNTTANDTCGDECLGRACTYYTNNGYTSLCLSIIAMGCYTGDRLSSPCLKRLRHLINFVANFNPSRRQFCNL